MKIALCTPVYGDTRAQFTGSLAAMLIRTLKAEPALDLRPFFTSSSNVAYNREQLVGLAREWGADWILWLDADHSFPPDTLLRLLSLGEPVVGANYPKRNVRPEPTAGAGGKLVWTTPQKAADAVVETVDHLGLGLCLVSMQAIDAAEPPLFYGEPGVGEDVSFFARLKAAGFAPKVDHALSDQVGHIGTRTLTNRDALALKQQTDIAADVERRRQAKAETQG